MPLAMLSSMWGLVLVGIVLLIIAYWVWDEMEDDDDFRETGTRVRERASSATGGVLGVIGAFAMGVAGVMYETGMQIGDLAAWLADVVAGNPEVSSGLFVTILGWLGISGQLRISPWTFAGIAAVALGVGLLMAGRGSRA